MLKVGTYGIPDLDTDLSELHVVPSYVRPLRWSTNCAKTLLLFFSVITDQKENKTFFGSLYSGLFLPVVGHFS